MAQIHDRRSPSSSSSWIATGMCGALCGSIPMITDINVLLVNAWSVAPSFPLEVGYWPSTFVAFSFWSAMSWARSSGTMYPALIIASRPFENCFM
jgi:hypothetical protein